MSHQNLATTSRPSRHLQANNAGSQHELQNLSKSATSSSPANPTTVSAEASPTDTAGNPSKRGRRQRNIGTNGEVETKDTNNKSLGPSTGWTDSPDENKKEEKKQETRRMAETVVQEIQVIPDLEEIEQMENIVNVAAAPALKVNRLKTLFDTNVDSDAFQGEMVFEGIDVSLLPLIGLCPLQQVLEDDTHWDKNVLFTEVSEILRKEIK